MTIYTHFDHTTLGSQHNGENDNPYDFLMKIWNFTLIVNKTFLQVPRLMGNMATFSSLDLLIVSHTNHVFHILQEPDAKLQEHAYLRASGGPWFLFIIGQL